MNERTMGFVFLGGHFMIRRLRNGLLMGIAVFLLSACSKTVKWEEEVPLNTGEVIWVERVDSYERVLVDHGLSLGWGLKSRSYSFSWQGQQFQFVPKQKLPGPIVIFAYPDAKTISIVDSAWPICDGYGEFLWKDGDWKLQKEINRQIVGRPRNVMSFYSERDGDIPIRVTQEWINTQRFDLPQRGGFDLSLPASKVSKNCSGGN